VIVGTVDEHDVPSISLNIAGRLYRAIIDTGFNGDLELPESLRKHLRPEYLTQVTSYLAGGVTIQEDLYRVTLSFDGELTKPEVTFVVGREILIGTKMLRRHRLSINFVKRTVRLQRLV
jgi:predicted aspartyl protease